MKTKEFFLLILIVAAGVILYHAETGRIEDLNFGWEWDPDWGGLFSSWGQEFTFQETREVESSPAAALEVVNNHGSVEVQGNATDKISITLVKRIWRKKEAEARGTAESLELIVQDDGQKVLVTTNREQVQGRRFETDFTVSVPPGFKVTVQNSYGQVKTVQTGETTISNPHGEVMARDIRGKLSVQNSYEDVDVAGVASDSLVRSQHAELVLRQAQGRVQVDHSYGSVRLEDIVGDVTVTAPHSEIIAVRLAGTVKVESSYEPISLTEAGSVQVDGRHSDLRLEGIRGDVDITDSNGTAELLGVTGKLTVNGNNLAVIGRRLEGPENAISSSYQDVLLADFTGKTTVSLRHAGLRLEPGLLVGDLKVEGEYCPIELAWPAGGQYSFASQTRNSEIHWELSTPPSFKSSNGISILKAFQEVTGKPLITLNTSYGDITVEEAARAQAR